MPKLEKYEASFNKVYGRYKRRALKLGIQFSIDKQSFRKMAEQNCRYCDAEPTEWASHKSHRYNGLWKGNGIDRIDNKKGYTIDNVQPCCSFCNKLKSNLEEEDFLEQISKIVSRMNQG